jgi:alanine racemase
MATGMRSCFTLDLDAVRWNVRRLLDVLDGAELWAVVKADAYGHGAADVAPAALDAGATALCVASVAEGLALRPMVPGARLLVLGATPPDELGAARDAGLELVAWGRKLPEGVPVHVKLDTGMGRWGGSELAAPGRDVVGLMTHFASADTDAAFTEMQLDRFLEATADHARLVRHAANSAAALTLPRSRLDAARCGIALYGISPFGDDGGLHGLRPALRWESEVADTKLLRPGDSTGYGRHFVATEPTWVGLVPVGYADGFRRDMTGTEVLVGDARRRVVGTVSMDVIAVELPGPVDRGTPVALIGGGILVEEHARVADTIGYEITCGLTTHPPRADRSVLGG